MEPVDTGEPGAPEIPLLPAPVVDPAAPVEYPLLPAPVVDPAAPEEYPILSNSEVDPVVFAVAVTPLNSVSNLHVKENVCDYVMQILLVISELIHIKLLFQKNAHVYYCIKILCR